MGGVCARRPGIGDGPRWIERGNATGKREPLASNYFFSKRSVPLLDPRSSLRSRDSLLKEKGKISPRISRFSLRTFHAKASKESFQSPKIALMKESSILSFLARRGSLISSENSPPRLPRHVFVLFRLGHLPPSLPLSFCSRLIPSPTFCRRWLLSRCAH